jgi:4-hydroxythreonine-4-phosphate dehydrogenase
MGDPAGIGGEIIFKALKRIGERTIPVIVGGRALLESQALRLGMKSPRFTDLLEGRPGDVEILDAGLLKEAEFGRIDGLYGETSYRYILEALKLVFHGVASAVVTCPISKTAIRCAGIDFPGHTELLAHYGGVRSYVMMMQAPGIRVSLVTIHIPLKDVPAAITRHSVLETIVLTHAALMEYFRVPRPFLKVCGLNPHAGEEGILGSEDAEEIAAAIEAARSTGIHVEGPFAADSLFHARDCDGYIAMYHDQGLIPVKTIDFQRTVNITLGLPFVRTSVGHGTGFDIAGTGRADETSLIEAYRVAEQMILNSARRRDAA